MPGSLCCPWLAIVALGVLSRAPAAGQGVASAPGSDAAGGELLAWAAETEGFVVNVEAADFPEGRGLAAKRAISRGEVLLFIPDEHILRQRSYIVTTRQHEKEWSSCAAMAARLLQEASYGERSAHSHYIRALAPVSALPANIPTLSGPVIPLLRAYAAQLPGGSRLGLGQLIAEGLSCAEDVRQRMDVSAELAVWACSMTLSRIFRSEAGSEMWPIADLQNHHNNVSLTQTTRMSSHKGKRGGGLRADRYYSAGEQLFDSYGQAPNLILLCQYGFAIPENTLGIARVLALGNLHAVGAPQFASWMHTAPKGSTLNACGDFLQVNDDSGVSRAPSKSITSLKLNSSFGFEPVGLDCSRIGRYGFGSLQEFEAALASRRFTPVSSSLKELASSLPAPEGTVGPGMKEQRVDTAVFSDLLHRCSMVAKAFETPAFLTASQLMDVQPEDRQGGGAAILRALREEQKAAHHCARAARKFMRQTHGVELPEPADSAAASTSFSEDASTARSLLTSLLVLALGCCVARSLQ